jgi:hypothetical protein
VHQARPDLGRAAQRRLAGICQLLDSSFTWQSLKDYWDMDGGEGGRSASEALAALLHIETPASRKRASRDLEAKPLSQRKQLEGSNHVDRPRLPTR